MKRILLTLAAALALAVPATLAARSLRASAVLAPAAHSGVVCYTHCYPSGLCMTNCF